MAYSPVLRAGIGAVRAALDAMGIGVQDARFTRHGDHEPDADAPLVLVACSGGRDSMALAALNGIVCATLGVRAGVVIVDHGMQAGSDRVAAMTAARCRARGLDPVTVRTVEVPCTGSGPEADARDARYRALCEEARTAGAAGVLLAHTMNDQAETVLIGLLRSGGVDALAGMPASFERDGVRFARPLLGLTRAETTAVCEDLGLPWWDDPTNGDDPAYAGGAGGGALPLRSRLRHEALPVLERIAGSGVVAHLADGARLIRADKAYLDMQAREASAVAVLDPQGDLVRLSARALAGAHPAIGRRVIAHALGAAGVAASARQVEAIARLASDWHGQGAVSLPSGCTAFRQKHVIRVCQDGGHANRRRSRSD